MVEFVVRRDIKNKRNKVICSFDIKKITALLTAEEEQAVRNTIKNMEAGKIKVFDFGLYSLIVVLYEQNMTNVKWQNLGGEVYKKIKEFRDVKIALPRVKEENLYNFALGIELASYRFDKYFTTKKAEFYPRLEKVMFTNVSVADFSGYKNYSGLANAVRYARDLINEPANALTPQIMADDIKRLEYLGLNVHIMDETEMRERNFNLALSVAQGSANRPHIAVLQWKGNSAKDEFEIGLVGKGVTFDSGGISLKPAANMGDMKQDMAGAAAVVATMKALALQKVERNVVAVVGLVENMPSGTATRPGDIITSMSGQTVEIVNTDAEGRLVLADCLTYIQRAFRPLQLIDVATLTGAIVVALGHVYAGLFSNRQTMADKLLKAGENSGECLWQMPLNESYNKQMDSTIADMKNAGGRDGGSATAACFLQRYIEKNVKWAHIDIAGMDLSDGSKVLYPKGASGFGVRLLSEYINQL